jgi:hypothetical protein
MAVWRLRKSLFLPMLKSLVVMASNRLKYDKYKTKTGSCDDPKSPGNICMRLDIWVDGILDTKHILFFPFVKYLVVMAKPFVRKKNAGKL